MKLNTAAEKIKSGRGASITFALLIFLVCAVVGSVVLTAATASAGRLNKLAENDRRYYSVSSAAELIVDALDGREVVISGQRRDTTVTVNTYKIDGGVVTLESSVPGTPVSTYHNFSIYQFGPYGNDDTLLSTATRKLVFSGAIPDTVEACEPLFWDASYNPGGAVINNAVVQALELLHTRDSSPLDELKVNIDVEIKDSRLHLIIKNPSSATDTAVYSVELFFTPAYNTVVNTSSNTETVIENSGPTGYTERVTLKETHNKTTTVYWSLSEIKKGQ